MRTIQLLCLLVLLAGQGLFAQTTTTYLLIHKNNNTVDSISLADVDSLTHAEVTTIVSGPCGGQTSITYNGYTYQLVEIGTQCWFAENLRTAQYRNGDAIPNVTVNSQWQNANTGAWSHYGNDNQNENPYGKLYNWYAVDDARHLCPAGWHIPTDAEWSSFINYLDPNAFGGTITPNTAGGKMKSTGTQYWQAPNTDATNESGFSGLPGGYRNNSGGNFGNVGNSGYWWSSTEFDAFNAWVRDLYYGYGSASRSAYYKTGGLSCRCVRD